MVGGHEWDECRGLCPWGWQWPQHGPVGTVGWRPHPVACGGEYWCCQRFREPSVQPCPSPCMKAFGCSQGLALSTQVVEGCTLPFAPAGNFRGLNSPWANFTGLKASMSASPLRSLSSALAQPRHLCARALVICSTALCHSSNLLSSRREL